MFYRSNIERSHPLSLWIGAGRDKLYWLLHGFNTIIDWLFPAYFRCQVDGTVVSYAPQVRQSWGLVVF
jgi:hypothetical protein